MGLFRQHNQVPYTGAQVPQYTGLQLQTSAASLPLSVVYGMVKIPPNVVFYDGFNSNAIIVIGNNGIPYVVGYNYDADLLFSLCEGQITGINRIFVNTTIYVYNGSSPSAVLGYATYPGLVLHTGALGQAVDSGWNSVYPSKTLGYSGIAYIAAANFALSSSAQMADLAFEVMGKFYGTGPNGYDADPAQVIEDYLTNTQYGARYPSANIDLTTLLGADGDSSVQTYCKAMDLQFSPVVNQLETGVSVLTRWLQIINTAAVRSGGKLKFIPYGDKNVSGNGVTWHAPVDPVYDITDDHLVQSGEEDPIKISRIDPYTLPVMQRIEVLSRGPITTAPSSPTNQNQYQAVPVEARDQAALQQTGARQAPLQTMHEICETSVGAVVAQTMLQRGLYVRKLYHFTLDWLYILLDPMDVITLTDPTLNLYQEHVRITEIVENNDGNLDVTAENVSIGISTPGPNNATDPQGSSVNPTVSPAYVDAVFIYRPPSGVYGTRFWFGASGGNFGVIDPYWGSANVWASIDGGTSYTQVATVISRLRYGWLTAALADATGFDTTNTLSLRLAAGVGTFANQSDANAQNLVDNVLLIDSELVSFATQSLVSANNYNCKRIQRGGSTTTHAAHSSGALFNDTDDIISISSPAWLFSASTVKFKFQSANIFGEGLQGLGDCRVFTFTNTSATGGYSFRSETEKIEITGSVSSITTTVDIPAGAYFMGVWIRNLTTIIGPTAILVDTELTPAGGPGTRTGALGSAGISYEDEFHYTRAEQQFTSASKIVLTSSGGFFTSGEFEVTVEYAVM